MTLHKSEQWQHGVSRRDRDTTSRYGDDGTTLEHYSNADQPPPYEAHSQPMSGSSRLSSMVRQHPAAHSSPGPILPCVIPQITKAFGSPYGSPFARAYPPSLGFHNISQADFLAFLDGLNQVFMSHPVFRGISSAASIMQMCHGAAIVQSVGMGLQATSELSSAATSYTRTKSYLEACNRGLFHPISLHAAIVTTKDMMAQIGHPDKSIRLAPCEVSHDLAEDANSTMGDRALESLQARRLNALKGYVAPLDFDVPAVVPPESLLAKTSVWQAHRMAAKTDEKEAKRQKQCRVAHDTKGEALMQDKGKLERKLAELQRTLDLPHGKRKERKVSKAQENYEREEKKLQKKVDRRAERAEKGNVKSAVKEERHINKVRWLVIAQWQHGQ